MADEKFSVRLESIIKEFNLEILYAPEGFEKVRIVNDDINRPGLQLAGFFDYFEADRIQIMGKSEISFVERFTSERRAASFEKLFRQNIPALIITRSMSAPPECLEMAKKHNVTILRTSDFTSTFINMLSASLRLSLAPRITCHGVLVEVYGEGVLILGDSGVGKSETALELLKRGHRLIADDAVEIKKVSEITLVGTAPELIRHYIEVRGIGIIDVRRIFGMGAVKPTEKINLIIHLERWDENKDYDRLGIESQYEKIMDVKVRSLTVPVHTGRNLAVIIEVAAMDNRQKTFGFNAAQEFSDKIYNSMIEDNGDSDN